MKRPFKIVLTGGPCSGKTTFVQTLPSDFTVPEIATQVLADGYRYGTGEVQLEIFRRQLIEEKKLTEPGIVLLDRGTLDGAAYHGGIEKWCKLVGTQEVFELERYNMIIHLETAAYTSTYNKSNNPYRTENPETAKKIDRKIWKVWGNHILHMRVKGTLEEKKIAVEAILEKLRKNMNWPDP